MNILEYLSDIITRTTHFKTTMGNTHPQMDGVRKKAYGHLTLSTQDQYYANMKWQQWEQRIRATLPPSTPPPAHHLFPAPIPKEMTESDEAFHQHLIAALEDKQHQAQSPVADIPTHVLNPAPYEISPPLDETAKRSAISSRKQYERRLPETLIEFLNRGIDAYRQELERLPRTIDIHPEELKWLVLLGYMAGVYTNAQGVFQLRSNDTLSTTQIMLA